MAQRRQSSRQHALKATREPAKSYIIWMMLITIEGATDTGQNTTGVLDEQ